MGKAGMGSFVRLRGGTFASVTLLVDTSVWSLAFRRDELQQRPEVSELRQALEDGETVGTTGVILPELLQGFSGPRVHKSASTVPTPSRCSCPIVTIASRQPLFACLPGKRRPARNDRRADRPLMREARPDAADDRPRRDPCVGALRADHMDAAAPLTDQRSPIGLTSRRAAPVYNWRGRPIFCSGSEIISFHCAIQPTVRAIAKMAVNSVVGMPSALCTMPE